MNNQRKAIKVIATAAFATFLIALVPALAANGDTSGIGRFITIAYANAGANFASIRGRKAGENADDNETQYYALNGCATATRSGRQRAEVLGRLHRC